MKISSLLSHIFLGCIRPKVNVKARLEFELVYYNVAVQHVSHYIKKNPPYQLDPDTKKKLVIKFEKKKHDKIIKNVNSVVTNQTCLNNALRSI